MPCLRNQLQLRCEQFSLSALGMMWMTQYENEMPPVIRHWCDQGDGIPKYGWVAHDGCHFGVHEVIDRYYTLTSDFVKRPNRLYGGDWSAKIRIKPKVRSKSYDWSR